MLQKIGTPKFSTITVLKWNSLALQCSDTATDADGITNCVVPDQTALKEH